MMQRRRCSHTLDRHATNMRKLHESTNCILQGGRRSLSSVLALWVVQLPRCACRLGAGRRRLHDTLLCSRPGARGVLRLRPTGAPVLRLNAVSHIQVPCTFLSLLSDGLNVPLEMLCCF
jgi:hypothetical protein